jgi:osmoprotectant transport system substrate-binding protein
MRIGLPRRTFLISALSTALTVPVKAQEPVVVSSKLDIEGGILGQLMLLVLQEAEIPVLNRLQIGPTPILRQALLSGSVDLCAEYTGNAAFFFHEDEDPVWKDARQGYLRAASLDLEKNKLVWLTPAPADNTWVIAVPNALRESENWQTLEDFALGVGRGARVKLAASAEFVESPAGLPALEAAYGFRLGAAQLLVLSGGETSATMKAAADGISGVNAAMAYATDGAFEALDLYALEDTKHAEPVYAPAPVIRAATLADYPQIAQVLAPIFARLDLRTLRKLNERIALEGEGAETVAREFLTAGR